MAKSLIESLQQKNAEREAKKRADDFKSAVQYNMKKFNCIITPCYAYVGNEYRCWLQYEALPVEDKK